MTSRDSLLEEYWAFHPRFIFFKTVPENAKLLDIGAGSGGLVFWKEYMKPNRHDIEMYAIDLKKGEFFDYYKDSSIINLEEDNIDYPNEFFDAIIMSHIIEHIRSPYNLMNSLKKITKPNGMIYVEYPSELSAKAPSKEIYGNLCVISNFYDNQTHVTLYNLEKLKNLFDEYGFKYISGGYIVNKYIEDRLYNAGIQLRDQEIFTYAVWLKYKFAEYAIFQKV